MYSSWWPAILQKIEKTTNKNNIMFEHYFSFLHYCLLSCRCVILQKSILRNRKGGHGPPGPPVATALNTRLLLNVKRQMSNFLGKKPKLRKNRARSFNANSVYTKREMKNRRSYWLLIPYKCVVLFLVLNCFFTLNLASFLNVEKNWASYFYKIVFIRKIYRYCIYLILHKK